MEEYLTPESRKVGFRGVGVYGTRRTEAYGSCIEDMRSLPGKEDSTEVFSGWSSIK